MNSNGKSYSRVSALIASNSSSGASTLMSYRNKQQFNNFLIGIYGLQMKMLMFGTILFLSGAVVLGSSITPGREKVLYTVDKHECQQCQNFNILTEHAERKLCTRNERSVIQFIGRKTYYSTSQKVGVILRLEVTSTRKLQSFSSQQSRRCLKMKDLLK